MGVSGAGKTTLGALLAARLGCAFLDADDFHPPANVAKMTSGMPLDDADRAPWLARLNAELRLRDAAGESAVLACSALKQAYRDALVQGLGVAHVAYLEGRRETIAARLAARAHRYMPASLLESQFATLEPPARALRVDVEGSPEHSLEALLRALAAAGDPSASAPSAG